ncbi:hypothetical protein ACLQ2N_16080 [Streptomyces sp. DT224]|uniref:hypothetical protein n=1 Tax=Streptomyces sp. DT224 TaxID=3393426 RepID=UPI003CF706DE
MYDVVEVLVDGEALVPEAYRVDAPGRLVRTDGECWPDCQDMAAPTTEPGTFAVTYRWGLALDDAAIAAVSELTCHFLKGCSPGSCGCKVNRNVNRMSRQGVEVWNDDPAQMYREGRTGLPMADMWLAMVNPHGLTSPSRVYSPDYKPPRSTMWP